MHIGAEEKVQIARLFTFLLSGERVAHRCARLQAQHCNDTRLTPFFRRQARQELFHAFTFQSAILWLAPKGVRCPAHELMENYENLLDDSNQRHDLTASVLGLQVILEGMGDIILEHLNHDIEQREIGYRKIRHAILAQEDDHHATGLTYLENITSKRPLSDHQRRVADEHLSIISEIFTSLQGLLDYFDCDTADYIARFNHNIPHWIHRDALGYYPCPE